MPARVIQLAVSGKHEVDVSGPVRHYVAAHAVVCAAYGLSAFPVKLCRISIGKDGSIYVSFPYLKEAGQGILASPITPNDHQGPYTYDLAKGGVTADRHVKFSHHASGVVHFSDTGLSRESPDFPFPERQSYPLESDGGHVFQLHAYWLGGFEALQKTKKPDLYLKCRFDGPPFAVVVEGHWWRKSRVESQTVGLGGYGFTGPTSSAVKASTGDERGFFFLAAPNNPHPDHVLAIAVTSIPIASGTDKATMVFIGGVSPSGDSSTGSLMFMYPSSDSQQEK